jgi:hypothetical protein
VIFALGDYAVTMWGQPAHYWAGDYGAAFEANPVVFWCMALHPAAFHTLTFVWIACFSLVILKIPRVLALMVALCITFSHAFCTGTWLYSEPNGFYYALALCIGSAIIFVLALEASREDAM